MHEYPITKRIVEIAEEYARKNGGEDVRVRRIVLVAGDSAGYVPDTISLYFDEISRGGICDGATLEIKRVIPKLKCMGCGELFPRKPFSFACPRCGSDGAPTEIGREFYMESIEIEDFSTERKQ